MKNIFIVICCGVLLFAGCKENDTPIAFPKPSTDSMYILPAALIPAPDPHNVFVEEFSGQSCSNCPAAHSNLESIASGGHVYFASLYINNFNQTTPPNGAVYDFRDTIASEIGTSIYGAINGLPEGGVDRVPVGGQLLLYSTDWNSAVIARKAVVDSVNLAVESSFTGGVATITATVYYLQQMSTPLNLSIILTEGGMVDIQETETGYNNTYAFSDIFRDMVTSAPFGEHVLDSIAVKQAGTVYWRKYTYTPPVRVPAINPNNCHVIAFLSSRTDNHIIQSADTTLVP